MGAALEDGWDRSTDPYQRLRPPNSIECHEDIDALYDDAELVDAQGRAHIECGYCTTTTRIRSREAAHRWFRTHTCHVDAEQAAANTALIRAQAAIAYDLGILEDTDNPFHAIMQQPPQDDLGKAA